MANYEHNIDITAKVKTEADTSGLSEDIQKVLKKPFVLKLDADSSQLFTDIKKDVKSIQEQLEKALKGIDFSNLNSSLKDAFKNVDFSNLSEQIAKSITTGAQNGSRTIEEVLVNLKRQEKSINTELQNKRLSLAQDWANKQYASLVIKAEEMNSPQAVMDKLKKMKLTAKDLDSTAHISAWVEKIENEFNTSNLKDVVKNLNNSLNLAMDNPTQELQLKLKQIAADFNELDAMRIKPEFNLSGLNDALNKIQDYKALMEQTIMENSEITFGKAIQGIYNASDLTDYVLKHSVVQGKNEQLFFNVDGIETIKSNLSILAEALGAVKNEAGKFDLSNSLTKQFENISNSISQLIPKIEEMSRALSELSGNSILPSSAYEEQIKGTKSNLDDLEKQLDQRQKRIKEIQDAINTPTDKGEASQEKKYIASAKNTANKLQQGELVGNQTYTKYEKGLAILKEYLSLGGKLEDLNIRGGLTESSAIVQKALGDESVITSLEEGNRLLQEREELLSQLTIQEKNLAVAKAKEGSSKQEQEEDNNQPKSKKRKKAVSKYAITQDEFESIKDTVLQNAKQLFSTNDQKSVDLTIKQLESGMAKVSASVQNANGEWQKFEATVTSTGDLINQKYKDIGANCKLDKKLISNEKAGTKLSIQEQTDMVNRIRNSVSELSDEQKWTINVDSKGFVTIKNNLASIGEEAMVAEQHFNSVEDAISKFNKTATSSKVSLTNSPQKEIEKKSTQVKDTSSDEAQKKAEQAKKVLESLNDHTLAAKVEAMNNKVQNFYDIGAYDSDLDKAQKIYKLAYEQIQKIQNEISNGAPAGNFIDTLNSSMKDFTDAMSLAENKMKELKATKETLTEADKILTNWGSTQNNVNRLIESFTPYQRNGLTNDIQNQAFDDMKKYFDIIDQKDFVSRLNMGIGLSDDEVAELVDVFSRLNIAIKTTDTSVKALKQSTKGMLTESDKIISANKIEKWLEDNSRAAKEYGEELKNLANQMRNANTVLEKEGIMNRFNQITSEAGAKGLTGRSWWGSLKETFSHISQIFGSYQLVDIARDAGQQMIQYSRDVDTAMTNLRMATGVTKDEAKDLMGTYSQMGDELSALSTEVSAAATEWQKQGQSIEESNELAKSSIVLSKIGELSSEESTQYLTAALKGYQMSNEEAMSIVDKISTVDMASATSVSGLAEGMSKVASAAQLVNVDFDTLLGYLAAIGETTQQDMGSVGNALNTIFARMRNIKLGRLKDYQNDLETDLSNVETVLKGEGINLRDSAGQFRDFGDVLDETASRWKDFSKVSQSAIAQAFAGKVCARTCSNTWMLAFN